MPSAVEIRDGDLLLRPWSSHDADAVGVTPASPEIGRYLGLPFNGFPDPDPDAPAFSIVADRVPVGRIWCAAGKRPFEVGYLFAQGESVVVLCTHPDNHRSQRVAQRAGYRRDGEVAEYARFKGRDHTRSAVRAGRCLTP